MLIYIQAISSSCIIRSDLHRLLQLIAIDDWVCSQIELDWEGRKCLECWLDRFQIHISFPAMGIHNSDHSFRCHPSGGDQLAAKCNSEVRPHLLHLLKSLISERDIWTLTEGSIAK